MEDLQVQASFTHWPSYLVALEEALCLQGLGRVGEQAQIIVEPFQNQPHGIHWQS